MQADSLHCDEGHAFTAIGLALATNRLTVKALWAAIHALEEDAAGLDFLRSRHPDHLVGQRQREAAEARDAAQRLRVHASEAQRRLASLEEDVAASGQGS